MKLSEVLTEGGFVIGMGGMEKPKKITLFPNTVYFLGASSSPDEIIVTKVDDKKIEYVFTHSPETTARIESWIGQDLIYRGTSTWLNSGYVKYSPELAKTLHANLEGKKGSENGKAHAADYIKHDVVVTVDNVDKAWRAAERYGGVGSFNENGKPKLIINGVVAKDLDSLKKDKAFLSVDSIKKR